MTYFGEFRTYWRRLAASCLGIAFGYSIVNYLNNVFIPPLMNEFGWSSSTVATLGVGAVFAIVCQPLAGRITDAIGVRPMAIFGVASGTLTFLALSFMRGSFIEFFLLNIILLVFFASTTGPVVYSRLIAESFSRARGVALAVATCSYAISGAIAVPILAQYIELEGWRAGYRVMAGIFAVMGTSAILLIPASKGPLALVAESQPDRNAGVMEMVKNPAFKLIIIGVFLCSITLMMQTTQLGVILRNVGLTPQEVSIAISIYALGSIAGRMLCGAALDKFPTHIIAAFAMGLPAVGLMILAAGEPSFLAMALAVLFLGMSLGAEGDLAGYLAMTYFKIEVYSTTVGAFLGTFGFSAAVGAVILSVILSATGSFTPFLVGSAASALVGSLFFWQLKNVHKVRLPHGALAEAG